MSTLLALVPLAGCAAMMVLCVGMMHRGKSTSPDPADPAEVARLRAEVAELRAQVEPTDQPKQDAPPAR